MIEADPDAAAELQLRESNAAVLRAQRAANAQGSDICRDCGCSIPMERHKAAPFSKRCIECAEAHEADMKMAG
jgi:RNA polymerase-binding transcription factor DksA